MSHFWEQLTTRLGISADFSTTYHPETDGQTEIMNSVLERYLKVYVNYFQNDWASWLPSAEFVINNHALETTQCTPFLASSKQHPKMGLEPDPFINKPMDFREKADKDIANAFVEKMTKINKVLKEQMAFAQTSYEHYANVHMQNVPNYALGDEIWLNTRNMQTKRPSKKLSDKFDGPFPITKIISPHVYKLELPRDWTIHPVFHTNFFRPGSTDPLPSQLTTLPPPAPIIDDESQDTWEMTKILNFKLHRNKLQLLVDWAGDRPYWQPFENVTGTLDALNQYYRKYPTRPGNDVWQPYKDDHPDEF